MSERMHLHIPPAADAPVRDAATTRPWAQAHRKRPDGMFATEVFCADGETIATLSWYPVKIAERHFTTSRAANAALIVRAVNSHDALVAALKFAIPMMEEAQEALCGDDSVCFDGEDDLLMVALDKARAALALAEGAAP